MEEVVDVVRTNDASDAAQNKALGIIAYIWVLCIVTIIAGKDSRFAKFHANQGLVLLIGSIIIGVASRFVPILGPLLLRPVGGLVVLVLAIMGIISAANGEMKPLPLIGGIKLLN